MKRGQKPPEKKTPEKCKTCPYALGYIQTLVDPCPKCTGKASIFGEGVPAPNDERIFSTKTAAMSK